MKKRFVTVILIALLVSITGQPQSIRDRIQQRHSQQAQKEQERSKSPDYADINEWAAYPEKKNMSDSIPPFITGETRDTLADLFFLHPTTYTKDIRNATWNADLADEAVNNSTDLKTILFQATAFNNCCRIFAPRYRQAHLKAFLNQKSNASRLAFDLAYEDLKKAFQYYLDHDNHGRPIVIAAHSQGAMHAIRLLQDFFDGKPLQKQLVCAYIVGWPIHQDDFKNIFVGETPDATGCFVGWRSYKKGELDFIVKQQTGNIICVNPISWTTSTMETSPEQHRGAMGKDMGIVYRHSITAAIEPAHHILWVGLPDKVNEQFGKLKNYHVADYNLFYLDIRENVLTRVKTFLNKK